MLLDILVLVFLVLSGVLAGVLFAVDVAVVPMLGQLPGTRFMLVHRLLDPGFDPLMPHISKVALAAGIGATVFAGSWTARFLFLLAVVLLAAVAVVSEVFNVRMNRDIDTWNPDVPPATWSVTRVRWARANRVRTVFSVLSFLAAASGTVLVA